MTQASPTRRKPTRTLKIGSKVDHRRDDELTCGQVKAPDAFYLGIALRGVALSAQKLVHWAAIDLCTWERVEDLTPAVDTVDSKPHTVRMTQTPKLVPQP